MVDRCLKVVPNPSTPELKPYLGRADIKDMPVLIAAQRENCPWLVTFNVRHFKPGVPDVIVLEPGPFVQQVRHLLAQLR